MSRFGSDPHAFFRLVYQDIPPWEIDAPQPAMAALLDRHPPTGPVLDLGCGSGDLSVYLGQLGYEVVGIDFVETAIANARRKLHTHPELEHSVHFQLADALRPSLLQRHFGTVVDSGFFHLFDQDQCDDLVEEIAQTLLPGGKYFLHEFSIEFPMPNMPRQIKAEEIGDRFTPDHGWQIKEIRAVEFLSRVAPPVPAICACIERLQK